MGNKGAINGAEEVKGEEGFEQVEARASKRLEKRERKREIYNGRGWSEKQRQRNRKTGIVCFSTNH